MAKIRLGVMVGEASGSLGSTVFSHNRYGTYTRLRSMPVQPDTPDQQAAKNRLASLSAAYAALADDEQVAWRTYAQENPITDSLGDKRILTPHAAYVGINTRIDKAGGSYIDLPPVGDPPPALLTATITATVGAPNVLSVAFTATPLAAGCKLWAYGCLVESPTREYVKNWLRLFQVSSAAQASPLDALAAFEARFGTLQVGMTVHMRISVIDSATGLLSAPLSATAVVA